MQGNFTNAPAKSNSIMLSFKQRAAPRTPTQRHLPLPSTPKYTVAFANHPVVYFDIAASITAGSINPGLTTYGFAAGFTAFTVFTGPSFLISARSAGLSVSVNEELLKSWSGFDAPSASTSSGALYCQGEYLSDGSSAEKWP